MVSRELENTIIASEIIPPPAFSPKGRLSQKGPLTAEETSGGIKPLGRSFYERNTQIAAFELIGKILVLRQDRLVLSGKIVETEAYFGAHDPASHAYRGVTPRNQVMFGPAGFSYVYFTYGNHYCFNVTTEQEGVAGAVLIRAVEPISGISVMEKNRGHVSHQQLTNGPGKLTQAFGMTCKHSSVDLTQDDSFCITEGREGGVLHIQVTRRIGISRAQHMPYRFYLSNSPFVSVR